MPIDSNRPHVWSLCPADGFIKDFIYADHMADDDFVVPAAATHMLDPHIMRRLIRWVADEPTLRVDDICFSEIGSVRGWLPLAGSHIVRATGGSWRVDRKRTRVPMLCCDKRNPLWGAVVLADFGRRRFSMCWHGIEASLDGLLDRWRRHPSCASEPRFARNWVEWVGEVYINARERAFDVGYLAREGERHAQRMAALEAWRATLPQGDPDQRPLVDVDRDRDPRAAPPLQLRTTDIKRARHRDGDITNKI